MTPRVAVALVFGLVLCTPLASAAKAIDITPDSIVGIRLAMTQAKASSMLAKPVRIDRLEEGYLRLVSGKVKVEVYFRKGARGVVAVTTWSKVLRTAKQIGPCSSIVALKRGNLIFTVEAGRRVGVVGLGRDAASVYLALNAPACV